MHYNISYDSDEDDEDEEEEDFSEPDDDLLSDSIEVQDFKSDSSSISTDVMKPKKLQCKLFSSKFIKIKMEYDEIDLV